MKRAMSRFSTKNNFYSKPRIKTQDVENCFRLIHKLLVLSGTWELKNTSTFWIITYQCYSLFTKFSFVFLAFALPLKIINSEQPTDEVESFITSIAHSILLFKVSIIYFHKEDLKCIMTLVKRNFYIHDKKLTTENEDIIVVTLQKAKFVTIVFVTMITSTFFIYAGILPFLTATENEYGIMSEFDDPLTHNTTFRELHMRLPVNVWIPLDVNKSLNYELVFVPLLVGCVVEGLNLTVIDSLYFTLMIYMTGQFELLCDSIHKISQDTTQRFLETKENTLDNQGCEPEWKSLQKEAEIYIREYAVYHQSLILASEKIDKLWGRMFFVQFLVESIWLCLMGFEVMRMEMDSNRMIMIMLLICCLVQMGLYCIFGSNLMQQSENVYKAAYGSDWYNQSKYYKQTTRMMIMRAQKPVKITAGLFGPVSMPLFAYILQSSYSYLALLRQLNEQ
ncbi:Odorant receptor 53 [Blattella germanica]|nr:Odorant receptor 53 [Blattella germanica]